MTTFDDRERGFESKSALDQDAWLLNCANGTLDLRTGTLRDAHRDDLITKRIAVPYDPVATCPTFLHFLSTIMGGNEDLIAYLQRAIGYALTGSTREQVLFLFYGTTRLGTVWLMPQWIVFLLVPALTRWGQSKAVVQSLS